MHNPRWVATVGGFLLALGACDPKGSSTPPRAVSAAPSANLMPRPPAAPEGEPAPSTNGSGQNARSASGSQAHAPQPRSHAAKRDGPARDSRYVLGDPKDVGPAAPAAAFARGAVLVTRTDELVFVELVARPGRSNRATPSALAATRKSPPEFRLVARGPTVSATHAYWISQGRLVRRALAGGELEVLAQDARDGTRAVVAGSPDAVAYVSEGAGKQTSLARLRLADGRVLDLTPEGAAASSVSLASVGEDLIASYIDGRSGMTPVHARRFRSRSATLDPDIVVWVAGGTNTTTELASLGSPNGGWLLLPTERGASHFGLAALSLDQDPKMDPPLRWHDFENGLDRVPVAAATLCDKQVAIYVRPADSRPASDQELVLSELTLDEKFGSERLAVARVFADVSLFVQPGGAALVYVADGRTRARLIHCN